MAKSDKQTMGDVQRARELANQDVDHSKHKKPVDKSQIFRGVYYGYLPCDYCAGIKMTLSLKNKKNYLLVTQYAQAWEEFTIWTTQLKISRFLNVWGI